MPPEGQPEVELGEVTRGRTRVRELDVQRRGHGAEAQQVQGDRHDQRQTGVLHEEYHERADEDRQPAGLADRGG